MSDPQISAGDQTTIEVKDGCGNRCRDFDADCYDIDDKFACWKYDPEQGVCPFLTGELPDPHQSSAAERGRM